MLGEIGWRDVAHVGQRMVAMRDQHQLVAGQLELRQLRLGCAFDQCAVEGARQDLPVEVGRRIDRDVELDRRVTAAELGEVRGKVVGRAGGTRSEVERTGLELLHRMGRVGHDLDCPQRSSAGLGHGSPGVGEPDPPPIALQADRVLEVAELLGDRRLGQVEGGRRARNVLMLGDRDKGAKLLDGEGWSTHLDILVRLMKDITNNCAKRLNEC